MSLGVRLESPCVASPLRSLKTSRDELLGAVVPIQRAIGLHGVGFRVL